MVLAANVALGRPVSEGLPPSLRFLLSCVTATGPLPHYDLTLRLSHYDLNLRLLNCPITDSASNLQPIKISELHLLNKYQVFNVWSAHIHILQVCAWQV